MKEEKKVIELNLDDILPNRFQPRIRFDEDAINELSESIKEHGVIQPIVVRPIADKYEIIAGERRYKASVLAGMKTIPALVANLDDKDSAEIALIENVQRQDLTPIEEAVSYKKILDMGYLTQNQLADKLGKDQSTVANKLRLLNLDDDVQEALLNEKISERHARSLLKLSQKDQRELLKKIIEKRLTVRKTDEEINKILNGTNKETIEEKPVENKVPEPVSVMPEVKEATPIIPEVSEPLEVLDLDEKEEPKMNDQNVNIPVSPIIDEVHEEPSVNPGFMDINQIEQNATNIFEPKPSVDMNNLLNPSGIAPAPAPVEAQPQPAAPEVTPGKFFDVLNVAEEPQIPNLEPSPVADGFNAQPIAPAPVQDAPVLEPAPISSLPDVTPAAPVVAEPVTPAVPTEPVVETPAAPTVPTEAVVEEPEQPLDLDLSLPQAPQPQMPTGPVTTPDYSFLENLDNEPAPVSQPTMEASIPEPTVAVPNTAPQTNNMTQALDAIRACAENLKQLGYEVDTDEFDLENMYQVIFKVTKK